MLSVDPYNDNTYTALPTNLHSANNSISLVKQLPTGHLTSSGFNILESPAATNPMKTSLKYNQSISNRKAINNKGVAKKVDGVSLGT